MNVLLNQLFFSSIYLKDSSSESVGIITKLGKSFCSISYMAVPFGIAIDALIFDKSFINGVSDLPIITFSSVKILFLKLSHSFLFGVPFKKLKISHFLFFEKSKLSSQFLVGISFI